MAEWTTYLVLILYNAIRESVDSMLKNMGMKELVTGISMADLVLLAVGYWKKDTDWGKGLLYGALASIGRDIVKGPLIVSGSSGGSSGGSGGSGGAIAFGRVIE
jgi:hypothetical protein